MQKKILHIINPDKFTIPFIQFINREFDPSEHLFLCNTKPEDKVLKANPNVKYLHNRYRKNLFKNTLIFYKCIKGADKIILHGNPILAIFILFPYILKKTYWIIYGYEFDKTNSRKKIKINEFIHFFIKRFVLKRVNGHITHIKGDSDLANTLYRSSAKYYYSPMYLSNVVGETKQNISKEKNKQGIKKILVGNSTSPSNNHASIFQMLMPYKESNILIYCPLSYGIFLEYRDEVIRHGKELFAEKFIPLTDFMTLDKYNSFLQDIDIAIFNHYRQEAMGITLTLLNMGKTIYMNSHTTSYRSLMERGIQVFDNNIIQKDGLFVNRDVSMNPGLVYNEYNYEKLKSSLSDIFNN